MKRMKTIFFAITMFGIVTTNLYAATDPSALLSSLTTMDGKRQAPQTNKNLLLITFWATWCPTCKKEMRSTLPKLNEEAKLAVVTVNTEKEKNRVLQYVKAEGLKLPVFFDPDKKLREALQLQVVPAWALFSRENEKSPWKVVDADRAFDEDRIRKHLL